jgi:hypothetical protein
MRKTKMKAPPRQVNGVTARQAADWLGVSIALVKKLVGQKRLVPTGQVGNANVFDAADVEALKDRKTRPGPDKKAKAK